MASAPVLDFNQLLAPIPGDNPAGAPPAYTLIQQLNLARKEPDSFEETKQKQDWPLIIRLATETLSTKSKDLELANRLTEAVTQAKGFAGLRDGFTLLRRLLDEFWDHLYPMPEEGEGFEIRGKKLGWLNDAGAGAMFPSTIRKIPLIRERDLPEFSHFDWRGAGRAEILAALQGLPSRDVPRLHKAVLTLREDLTAAREELEHLAKVVEERVPGELISEHGDAREKINLINGSARIGTALSDVFESVADLINRLGIENVSESPGEGGHTTDGHASAAGPAGAVLGDPTANAATRADLYRQLDRIADALQKLEPHSPIPFLIKRSVKLGGLPFPQLMRAMIQEAGALDQLDRLLGIEHQAPSE
jgi:type VI secretion system protein ImpA